MIIIGTKKFTKTSFRNEEELENVVVENYEYLFGPNSIYLPKAKIKTNDGVGTIPDGFAIDIENKKWYIVEAELGSHGVWVHIAPQITKQILAALQKQAKDKICERAVELHNLKPEVKEKFEENNIEPIDVRKVLSDIVSKDPIIGIPIDYVSNDLKDWSNTQRFEVKLWVISKYAELSNPDEIMYEFPEDFRPDFDFNKSNTTPTNFNALGRDVGEITISTLIEIGHLKPNEQIYFEYGQRGTKKKKYSATIQEDGSLAVLGGIYKSPSWAALACMQDSGSNRKTVNGWTAWRTLDGKQIDSFRY
jgi:hypothetical protein